MAECGVKYIQGQKIARYTNSDGESNKRRYRFIGNKNTNGSIDLCRNAMFEPSENHNKDWINECLSEIAMAFRWHKPAIICSHRVNFIGSINPSNRDNGLRQLKSLLSEIKKRWPDVEFMSSDVLGDVIMLK